MEQNRSITDPAEWGRLRAMERAGERRTFVMSTFRGVGFSLLALVNMCLAIVEAPTFFRRMWSRVCGNRREESWGFIIGIAVGGACIGAGAWEAARHFGLAVGRPALWLIAATNAMSLLYELSRLGDGATTHVAQPLATVAIIPQPQRLPASASDDIFAKLVAWETIYARYLGKEYNFSQVVVPPHRDGFNRLIVIPAGLTNMELWECLKKLMPCYSYWNDLNSITSVRTSTTHYAIWVRDVVEADEEWKNHSANDLAAKRVNGVTLIERLAHELAYFDETSLSGKQAGEHLDINNWTLCSGSHLSDGGVPGVCWGNGWLYVSWCYPTGACGFLRSREAVS